MISESHPHPQMFVNVSRRDHFEHELFLSDQNAKITGSFGQTSSAIFLFILKIQQQDGGLNFQPLSYQYH